MGWIELRLDSTAEAVDWVRTLLVEDYDGTLQVTPYEAPQGSAETDFSAWAFTVRLYLPEVGGRSQVEKLSDRLSSLQRTQLTSALQTSRVDHLPAPPADLAYRIGDRFLLVSADAADAPTANAAAQPASDILLKLPASLAFGSGFHPATQRILVLLEHYIQPGMNVLDLGCGSGILSVAMAKLGARVTAIDNDPVAVRATQMAVRQNQVSAQVRVLQGSLGTGDRLGHWMSDGKLSPTTDLSQTEDRIQIEATPTFDLIAANILARVHIALAQDYHDALRSSETQPGLLLIAGFTTEYVEEITKTLQQTNFELLATETSAEWVGLAFQVKSSATDWETDKTDVAFNIPPEL